MPRATNNFDLIRLIAAMQVVVVHGIEHLHIDIPAGLYSLINWFPGVTVFFVISGYLITGAYLKSSSLASYARNRFLRIYPGLWACFVVTLVLVLAYGKLNVPIDRLMLWIIGEVTIAPHTPPYLRDFGTGSINGSLWTIPVELQFYAVLPLLLLLIDRSRLKQLVLFLIFLGLGVSYLWIRRAMHGELPARILLMTVFSWIYLFMVGVVLQLNQAFVLKYLRGKAAWWLFAYLGWTACLSQLGVPVEGNDATPLSTLPLGLVVISLAFTATELSARLLRGNDFSYGLYIYHMLVVNVFVESGWIGSMFYLAAAAATSMMLAVLSWNLVERPALQLKRESQFSRATA